MSHLYHRFAMHVEFFYKKIRLIHVFKLVIATVAMHVIATSSHVPARMYAFFFAYAAQFRVSRERACDRGE